MARCERVAMDKAVLTAGQAAVLRMLNDDERGIVLSRIIDFVFYGEEFPEYGDTLDALAVIIALEMRGNNG